MGRCWCLWVYVYVNVSYTCLYVNVYVYVREGGVVYLNLLQLLMLDAADNIHVVDDRAQ